MNKYLVKLAELVELEPGVIYDTTTHSIKPGRKYMEEQHNKGRFWNGVPMGVEGAVFGGLAGLVGGVILADKYTDSVNKELATGVGGVLGAALGGKLGHMLGKSEYDPKDRRDDIIAKLENRHEKAIDKIEGW